MAFAGDAARSPGTHRRSDELPARTAAPSAPGLIMAAIYRTLLDEIARDGYHVLDQRTSLTPLRKLWIAWKTSRRS